MCVCVYVERESHMSMCVSMLTINGKYTRRLTFKNILVMLLCGCGLCSSLYICITYIDGLEIQLTIYWVWVMQFIIYIYS